MYKLQENTPIDMELSKQAAPGLKNQDQQSSADFIKQVYYTMEQEFETKQRFCK